MFKKSLTKTTLLCLALITGIIHFSSAQAPSISVSPAEGFILELDPNNPQATVIFKIYNDGQSSVSVNLQVESADSTYLLYADEPDTNTFNGNIWRMRPDGSGKTQLTSDTLDLNPVWSPDGATIAFYSYRSGNADIWIMNSDGTNLTNLTNHSAGDFHPHFSPDGQYIIFGSDRDDPNGEIYRMTFAGANVERLTFNSLIDYRARYSPDGQYFVTNSRVPGETNDIYVYTSDGQSFTNIGVYGIRDYQPSWSPDGKRVVWCSGNHWVGELDIVSANKDSSDFRLEYATPENDYIPRYSPDGQFLTFSKSTFYPTGGDEIFVWHKSLNRLTQITDSTSVTREWGAEWSPFLNSPSWLTVDPDTGQIAPGDSISITINVDASGLPTGDHTASVMINDAANNNLLAVVPLNLIFGPAMAVHDGVDIPATFTLSQNYPNPFNPATTISYSIEHSGAVEIKIYNSLGQLMRMLVNQEKYGGKYTVAWDGKNDKGQLVASGRYFYTLKVNKKTLISKSMIMLK